MKEPKLTIELVPSTAWMTNVRSKVSVFEWDKIRKKCYTAAGNKCEVCGGSGRQQGARHAVECHEIWLYEDETKQQVLTGFIALCPRCHKVKHAGLAMVKGEMHIVLSQLKEVNGMSDEEALAYVEESFKLWRQRSEHKWSLDITYMDAYLSS